MKFHRLAIVLLVTASATSPAFAGGPSMWAKARDPDLERRGQVLAQAEARLVKARYARRQLPQDPTASLRRMYLAEAKEILLNAGAATSRDRMLRLRLAETLFLLGDHKAAVPVYESLLQGELPAAVRADVYANLASAYGTLQRRDEEIAAYSAAISLEPVGIERSRLLTNRAEAYMAVGKLTAAVEGYRTALASLSQIEMKFGVTTLWGLAVALDRDGDLEEGLAAIRLARYYDGADSQIRDRSLWTFDPEHDEHWYMAIGHWSAARFAELGAARAEWYGRAVSAWEEYIATAPPDDRWVELAKVRLKQCEKERDVTQKRVGPPKKIPAPGTKPLQ